jgi:hypothetical protein
MKQIVKMKRVILRTTSVLVLFSILISCGPSGSIMQTATVDTASSQTPVVTVPPLPAVYQTKYLNPLDAPQPYIEEPCQYVRNKWKPSSARPGTVVMIIMFKEIKDADGFKKLMTELQIQGFQAINTKQFLAFMERDVKIPFRSVLLMQDGDFTAKNFNENFRVYWDTLRWPVVNGWVSQSNLSRSILKDNVNLENEGWVDHQAMGVVDTAFLSDETSKAVIARELQDSLTGFADHFAKTPYAFIWPNGGFGLRPVQAARQLGYQLGFTSNLRGPVMYNWVPLADDVDPKRPMLIPEGAINDPLMTLPRYPAEQALDAIDSVRLIGQEAAAYAEANKTAELNYYDVVCKPALGPIPGS